MSTVPRSLTRFLLEAGFLVLVALAAGLARLNSPTIVLLVAAVWGVMAVVERLASRDVKNVQPVTPRATPADRRPEPLRPTASTIPGRARDGFETRRRTWEWGAVMPSAEQSPAGHVRVLQPEEPAETPSDEAVVEQGEAHTAAAERDAGAAAEVREMPGAPEREPEPVEAEDLEPRAEVPMPEPAPAPMPPPEPPAPPEHGPEPHRPPTPRPSVPPTPVPHEPPAPEPTPIHEPTPSPPGPAPEPPPAAASEPEPEPEEHAFEPERGRVVPLVPRASAAAYQWNIWELERGSKDVAGVDPELDQERSFLILYLRQFANADGVLPPEFDALVRESFGDVIGFAHQG